mgnify:CR=1 FL=1
MNNSSLNKYIKTDIIKDIVRKIDQTKYYTNHGPYSKKIEKSISKNFKKINFVALSEIYIALLIIIEAFNSKRVILIDVNFSELFEKLNDHIKLETKKFQKIDKVLFHQISKNKDSVIFLNLKTIYENENFFNNLKTKKTFNVVVICNDISELQNFESIKKNFNNKFNFIYLFTLDPTKLTGCFIGSIDNEFNHVIRNYRSSYGTNKFVSVSKTCNARFSETQAILCLQVLGEQVNRE